MSDFKDNAGEISSDALQLAIKSQAAFYGMDYGKYISFLEAQSKNIAGAAKAARGAAFLRSLPFINAALTAKESVDVYKQGGSTDEFRDEYKKLQHEGLKSIPARTALVIANPINTLAALGEGLGDDAAGFYFKNIRPDIDPSYMGKGSIYDLIARAEKKNAIEEIRRNAEIQAERMYGHPSFRYNHPELRQ